MGIDFKETAHLNIDKKKFNENFDRIFGKKKEEKPEKKSELDLYKEALDKSHDVHLKLTVDYLDLKNENDQLREALSFINDVAPASHKYNDIELQMVMKARKTLKDIKAQ